MKSSDFLSTTFQNNHQVAAKQSTTRAQSETLFTNSML